MKKILYTAALALPLAVVAGKADAFWFSDSDKAADTPAVEQPMTEKAEMKAHKKELKKAHKKEMKKGKHQAKHDDKSMKKMMKHHPDRWLEKETAEINEDFDEAVEKISKTNLSEDAKNLLLSQAKSNKELAMKQAKEKSEQMARNMKEREKFRDQIQQEKANRKAVREVEDIL